MSFTSLPSELQDSIVDGLDTKTLLSLCLTSKSVLPLARIHLYRSITLYVDAYPSPDLVEVLNLIWPGQGEIRHVHSVKMGHLFHVFEIHPEWRTWIKELKVEISGTVDPKSTVYETISCSSNLQRLEVRWKPKPWLEHFDHDDTEETLNQQTVDCLIQATTPSVKYLDLGGSRLTQEAVVAFLSKTPLLETFAYDVKDDSSPIFSAEKFPSLRNLQRLVLGGDPLEQSAFLAITSSSTLTALELDFTSVSCIPTAAVSTLKTLKIRCLRPPAEYDCADEETASHLATILPNCHSLLVLEMEDYENADASLFFQTFESLGGLDLLPSFPRRLVLSSFGFSISYLYDYLSKVPPYHLELFVRDLLFEKGPNCRDPFKYSRNQEAEQKVEDLCKEQFIKLHWV
ncbi:hypothetical protein JCM5350_005945 [Sporobolomyces pararoseus]